MFDINKDISYVPFFIKNKKIFNGKEEKDYFVVPQEDGTELWYILVDVIDKDMPCDSYCIEKNKDGSINWIREICYINGSMDNQYKISVDKTGTIYEKFPDGHIEEKTVEMAQQNIDKIQYGDYDSNGFNLSSSVSTYGNDDLNFPNSQNQVSQSNDIWPNPGDGLDFPPTQK